MDFLGRLARTAAGWLCTLLRSPRHQVMTVMVIAAFLLWDRLFPLSSFPMYGDFPDRTDYVYLADAAGNPLPMHDLFGFRSTFIKRIYSRKVGEIVREMERAGEEPELHLLTVDQLRPAGDATLQWMVENDRRRSRKQGPVPPLQLVEVDVMVRDGRLVRDGRVVGQYPGGPP
jgi:hypothetical protein